jgi:hypothetical protein
MLNVDEFAELEYHAMVGGQERSWDPVALFEKLQTLQGAAPSDILKIIVTARETFEVPDLTNTQVLLLLADFVSFVEKTLYPNLKKVFGDGLSLPTTLASSLPTEPSASDS